MLASEWQRIVALLGDQIAELRSLLGWSQTELADAAVVSQGTISRMESGSHPGVPFHSVVVVVRTLGAAADKLALGMSPFASTLCDFADACDAPRLVEPPLDPALVQLVDQWWQLSDTQREAVVDMITTFGRGGSRGQELHQRRNQEAGPTAPRPRRAAGQEDTSQQDS